MLDANHCLQMLTDGSGHGNNSLPGACKLILTAEEVPEPCRVVWTWWSKF